MSATNVGQPPVGIVWPDSVQVISLHELKDMKPIGGGCYGQVYSARWAGCDVAVKVFKETADADGSTARTVLSNELTLLSKCSHPHVIQLHGVCPDARGTVMQHCQNGPLHFLLRHARAKVVHGKAGQIPAYLSWHHRLVMLRQAAAGMLFLHSRNIMHGNLQASSLLLDSSYNIRIASFGFARVLPSSSTDHMITDSIGDFRWLAPELIECNRLSKASDAYAYGIVMWEMLTWLRPFNGVSFWSIPHQVKSGSRPVMPPDKDLPGRPEPGLDTYKQLMTRCWAQDPAARPSFDEILDQIQGLISVVEGVEAGSQDSGQGLIAGLTRLWRSASGREYREHRRSEQHKPSKGTRHELHIQPVATPAPLTAAVDDVLVPALPVDPSKVTAAEDGAAASSSAGVVHAAAQPKQSMFPDTMQVIDVKDLEGMVFLGQGGYGQVIAAKWLGQTVAVKRLLTSDDDLAKHAEAFRREILMLGACNHPSIARLIAVCYETALAPEGGRSEKVPLMVMEFYGAGSLYKLYKRARDPEHPRHEEALRELTWQKRLRQLHDVAAGMNYLHSRNPAVIHGDLRCDNLLLEYKNSGDEPGPRFHVRIGDFGLSRLLEQCDSRCSVSKVTNCCWLAPEVLEKNQLSKASDVYSFAMVLWELLTGTIPFEGLPWHEVMIRRVKSQLDTPEVPPDERLLGKPGKTLERYKQLMAACWSLDKRHRPGFQEIMKELQGMLEEESRRPESGHASTNTSKSGNTTAPVTPDQPAGSPQQLAPLPPPRPKMKSPFEAAPPPL